MKLKPLPKAIVILAIVAGVGYGVSFAIKNHAAETPSVAAVPTPTVTTISPGPAPTASTPPTPNTNTAVQAVNDTAPVLTPAPTNDAGLANVLGVTKK